MYFGFGSPVKRNKKKMLRKKKRNREVVNKVFGMRLFSISLFNSFLEVFMGFVHFSQ